MSSLSIPAWKWKTDSPPVSPSKGRHVRDKVEQSPNNRAACQRCGDKITKGQDRVGIQSKFQTPQGYDVWRLRYYHEGCVTESTKRSLHLEPAAKASKKAKASNDVKPQSDSFCGTILKPRVREQMEQDLRKLRRLFAQTQECEEYKIFPNQSLQELVKKLPTNRTELQQCWGIKGKRCQQYGDSILHIINSYLLQHYRNETLTLTRQTKNTPTSNSAASPNSDSDDDIETGPSLSVEDIVAQRVREAEARGEVFEIL